MSDPRKTADLLLALGPTGDEKEAAASSDAESSALGEVDDGGFGAVASDAFRAIKGNDEQAFADAFRSAVEICMAKYRNDEE